jgi:hypothetical protein
MRFDRQKAFPYPVLRPSSDDYKDCEFQVTPEFIIEQDATEIGVKITYALSSEEIMDEIKKANAEYVSIVSCRDTYFRTILATSEQTQEARFDIGLLRGEVRVEPYVVVRKEIQSFIAQDINPEFGAGPFRFSAGDILAQDDAQIFYVDRDLFKSVTSVFDLVKSESLSGFEWTIGYSSDHVQIAVGPNVKEKIDNARNDPKNKAVLFNSILFAAVMQAIQKLKDTVESGDYDDYKWAQIIKRQLHNKGYDMMAHDAYLLAERLLQYPLALLDEYFFKGDDK